MTRDASQAPSPMRTGFGLEQAAPPLGRPDQVRAGRDEHAVAEVDVVADHDGCGGVEHAVLVDEAVRRRSRGAARRPGRRSA